MDFIICAIIDGEAHPVIIAKEDRKTIDYLLKGILNTDGVVNVQSESIGTVTVNGKPIKEVDLNEIN